MEQPGNACVPVDPGRMWGVDDITKELCGGPFDYLYRQLRHDASAPVPLRRNHKSDSGVYHQPIHGSTGFTTVGDGSRTKVLGWSHL